MNAVNAENEIVKGAAYTLTEAIDYEKNAVSSTYITKKLTGSVQLMSFDKGTCLETKTNAFDTILQIIEGKAEIIIEGKSSILLAGQSIIVPAHQSSSTKPGVRFKMTVTVIKSGYE